MLARTLAFALAVLPAGQPQSPCAVGQVLEVNRGYDYTLTLCGGTVVGLRGVEPPMYTAITLGNIGGGPAFGGEVLGSKDITKDALTFLSGLIVGKRVTLAYDGYRIGDFSGYGSRQYAYVYLPDKTLVNAEMIRRGFGYAALQGSHPMRDRFIALEGAARREKVGLWSS